MYLTHEQNKKTALWYTYENRGFRDPITKKPKKKRTCIGKYNPITCETTPTDGRMKNAKLREKELATQSVVMNQKYSRKFYGATLLLDKISEKLRLPEDLKQFFPKDNKKILSLAYYNILGNNRAMGNFNQWGAYQKHPFNKEISSQRISELFQGINQDSVYQFIKSQSKKHIDSGYYAFDSTSISSYSKGLSQVQYGYNKENDKLKQLNISFVFSESKNIPIFYKKNAGNIPDTSTLKDTLRDLKDHDLNRLKFVMDKGYCSVENIAELIKNKNDFIISLKLSDGYVKTEFDKIYDCLRLFRNLIETKKIYATRIPIEWTFQIKDKTTKKIKMVKKELYIHFYFDPFLASKRIESFNFELVEIKKELEKNKDEVIKNKYFTVIKGSDKEKNTVIPDEGAIQEAMDRLGYYALLTSEQIDSAYALDVYRNKDIIEKAFGDVKEKQGFRRVRVSSEKSLEGKLFIQYISLILLSYIKKQMQTKELFKNYTIEKLFNKLNMLEYFECPGKKSRLSNILDVQKDLFKDLEVSL